MTGKNNVYCLAQFVSINLYVYLKTGQNRPRFQTTSFYTYTEGQISIKSKTLSPTIDNHDKRYGFWKRCFLKTSVSNGIIYTKYTQNSHTIEPPFNIATQSAT